MHKSSKESGISNINKTVAILVAVSAIGFVAAFSGAQELSSQWLGLLFLIVILPFIASLITHGQIEGNPNQRITYSFLVLIISIIILVGITTITFTFVESYKPPVNISATDYDIRIRDLEQGIIRK